jgi:hypothetical protein
MIKKNLSRVGISLEQLDSLDMLSIPPRFNPSSMPIDEDLFWTQAFEEYEGTNRNKGLWVKLFAQFDGNETKVKVEYLKTRAQQLILNEKRRLFEIELSAYEIKKNEDKARKIEEQKKTQQLDKLIAENRYANSTESAILSLQKTNYELALAVKFIVSNGYAWLNPDGLLNGGRGSTFRWVFKSKTSSMEIYQYSEKDVIEFSNSIKA